MPENRYGIEPAVWEALQAKAARSVHPERYMVGKVHPDRAKQFKPFAALRGYEELVQEAVARAAAQPDYTDLEDSC